MEEKVIGVTKKDGEILASGVVVQNIVVRQAQRSRSDIQDWRNRHIQAEGINGSRVTLYDLYADMMLDGFLKRLVAKRVLSVTKNKIKYVDAQGKHVEASSAVLTKREFRKLRQYIQLYKAWGISVIELINEAGALKVFDVPKKHIVPTEGKIIFEQYGNDGISYRKLRTVIEIGEWNDLGYLLEACAYALYKRGVVADWANYAQVFGIPFREARYDGFNDVVRKQLELALEKAAGAAYAILPKEAELTIHEAQNQSGSNELFDSLRKSMNEEMTVLILGATESTTSSRSSGYAQSETHKKTVDEVANDDKEDELSILNEKVLPVLVLLGLLPDGGSFIYDEPMDIEAAEVKMRIAESAKRMGVPIDDDYIYQITGIPKPVNYNELKAKQEEAAQLEDDPEPEPVQKTGKEKKQTVKVKKLSFSDRLRLSLLDFFDQAHEN